MSEGRFSSSDTGAGEDLRQALAEATGGEGGGGETRHEQPSAERAPRAPLEPAARPAGGPSPADRQTTAEPRDEGVAAAAAGAGGTQDAGEGAGRRTPADDGRSAPQHWSEEDRTSFEALPVEARPEFLRLYKRMETGFGTKLQRAALLEREYGGFQQAMELPEVQASLARAGLSPGRYIYQLAAADAGLNHPQNRDIMAARILHQYGCDPAAVARYLTQLRGGAGGAGQPAPQQYASGDGDIAARVGNLEAARQAEMQAMQAARLTQAQNEINAFSAATDGEGRPAHPHFVAVQDEMVRLARLDRQMGREPVLNDLYERATWSSPQIRQELIASEFERGNRREAGDRQAKAAAARRAGSSINGAPSGSGNPTLGGNGADRSIRDNIISAYQGAARSGGRI